MSQGTQLVLVATSGLQGFVALVLAVFLLSYATLDRRRLLTLWGYGWLAIAAGFIGSTGGLLGVLGGLPPEDGARIVTAVLGVGGRAAGAILLVAGALRLGRDDTDQRASGGGTLGTALGVGAVVGAVVTMATLGADPVVRSLVRVSIPSTLVATAGWIAALALWRRTRDATSPAPRFLITALVLWSATSIVSGGGVLSDRTGAWLTVVDTGALLVVTVATIAWLLETERGLGRSTRSDLVAARSSLEAQLLFVETLSEVSIDFIDAGPERLRERLSNALASLSPRLGALWGVYYDLEPDGSYRRYAVHPPEAIEGLPERIDPAELPIGTARLAEGHPLRIRPDPATWDLPAPETARLRGLVAPGHRVLAPCMVGGELGGFVGFELPVSAAADGNADGRFRLVGDVFSALLTRMRLLREDARRLDRVLAAFRSLPDVVVITSLRDGTIIEVNEGFVRALGWSREAVIGTPGDDLRLWLDPQIRDDFLETVRREGRVDEKAVDIRGSDGTIHPHVVSSRRIDLAGEPCALTVGRDRTEMILLEEQLRQAQRLEAIGRLAGGIAHDFNNLLTAIGGEAELLQIEGRDDPATVQAAGEILRAQERGRDLTRRLLAFARQEPRSVEILTLSDVVDQLRTLLVRLLGPDVRLAVDTEPELRVEADRGQLEQVLMNLIVNARDALEGQGGEILVGARRVVLEKTIEVSGVPVPPGRWAVLEVEDDGVGIEPDLIQSIFDPFFTTKEVGVGTGLGLSTVYGIAQQSRGHVTVESTPGEGSRFRIWLPEAVSDAASPAPTTGASPGPATESKDGTTVPARRGPTGRILLVEDDRAVRRLIHRALERAGHAVVSVADGAEALRIADAEGDTIDLLLTDLSLPGASGTEIAMRMRVDRPDLRVLVMSGFHDGILGVESREDGIETIQKPFRPREIVWRVERMLEEADPGRAPERD